MSANKPSNNVPWSKEALQPVPAGWCWAQVQDVGEVKLGRQRSPKHHQGEHMRPYLRVANVFEERIDASDVLEMNFTPEEFDVYQLKYGDILLNEGQSLELVGRPAMFRDEIPGACFQNTLVRFRASEGVLPEYALKVFIWYLHNQRFQRIAIRTVNIAHLGARRLAELEFPLPPTNEQRRIVARIEELFSDLDASVAALERAKVNLKRYRAAVLNAAMEGRLTEEWRSAHDVEPASELLNRILDDRRCKWEADKLAEYERKGKKPPKNWRDKYKEPACPDTTSLAELPSAWCWVTVEQMGKVQLGRQRSPKHVSKDYPTKYIRAANITEDGLDTSNVFEMEFTPSELERYQLKRGDLVVSEASGSPDQVGKPAVWNDELPVCCFQNTVIRLRPIGVRSAFLLAVFKHCYFNNVFSQIAGGMGINHLSAGKFSRIPIPFAPDLEQVEIANEVERQLSLLKKTEELIEINFSRASRARQSILQRAFEGKLVPQDPNDEPADALLARIKRDRETRPIEKPAPPKGGKKKMATPRRPLRDVLREHPDGLSPDMLLRESGRALDRIEDFYRELRAISDEVEELRPEGMSINQWPAESRITLRLRSA